MTDAAAEREEEEAESEFGSVEWLSDYVYGTIATLVAVAGLTFENHPRALPTAGVVLVGTMAIWFAHALSRLIVKPAWRRLGVRWADVALELWASWSIVTAAVPAVFIFVLADVHLWPVHIAFALTDIVGVVSLAVVGMGSTRGGDRPLGHRLLYALGLVTVGVVIVALESAVRHL